MFVVRVHSQANKADLGKPPVEIHTPSADAPEKEQSAEKEEGGGEEDDEEEYEPSPPVAVSLPLAFYTNVTAWIDTQHDTFPTTFFF